MMNQKDKTRVENYLGSRGIYRMWYYIVIALFMGNVSEAVAQYEREQMPEEEEETSFQPAEQEMSYGQGGCVIGSQRHVPVLTVDEEEEEEDIDLLTTAILAQHALDYPETRDYDIAPVSPFGGGGDFGGGGAGGSWESDSY